MDLLFKRYASPFSCLDMAINQKQFPEFIDFILSKRNEEMEWNYYLHKVDTDISFNEFRESIKPISNVYPKIDFGATLKQSKAMLNNFNPQERGNANGII
jgi:hypothetical protein